MNKIKFIIALLLIMMFTYGNSFAMNGFYSFEDENGVIHFSNIGGDVRFKPVSRPERVGGGIISVSKSRIYSLIEKISRRHSVDSRLVKAIVKVESDFNPNAVSKAGAKGLMQLMPETAYDLNVSDPFSPSASVIKRV